MAGGESLQFRFGTDFLPSRWLIFILSRKIAELGQLSIKYNENVLFYLTSPFNTISGQTYLFETDQTSIKFRKNRLGHRVKKMDYSSISLVQEKEGVQSIVVVPYFSRFWIELYISYNGIEVESHGALSEKDELTPRVIEAVRVARDDGAGWINHSKSSSDADCFQKKKCCS
ncbi:hypothetical protein BDA99DRAFT_587743 [Phascolomyces articulosus]|uniref:Uncharacterized protein n=1 Tax=Phascolomyces articulosus TaxID=60185 RepID=A0AAD5JSW4_9FUNG|nr:hypothetical protein BDA99DRAFT_587743 [Phascolomyces articulosus]